MFLALILNALSKVIGPGGLSGPSVILLLVAHTAVLQGRERALIQLRDVEAQLALATILRGPHAMQGIALAQMTVNLKMNVRSLVIGTALVGIV